jgi:hypothetical protein
MGCSDVLITDWIASVVINGEHHVELKEVHQLHKQPRCTAHGSAFDTVYIVQKHANTHSIVVDSTAWQCTKFDSCKQLLVIAKVFAGSCWHLQSAQVNGFCLLATASEIQTYIGIRLSFQSVVRQKTAPRRALKQLQAEG